MCWIRGKRREANRKEKGGSQQEGKGKKSDRERERKENGDFLGVLMVEARRSEKKSRSMHRELRVGTKILEFCQTLRGREFSYLGYF